MRFSWDSWCAAATERTAATPSGLAESLGVPPADGPGVSLVVRRDDGAPLESGELRELVRRLNREASGQGRCGYFDRTPNCRVPATAAEGEIVVTASLAYRQSLPREMREHALAHDREYARWLIAQLREAPYTLALRERT